MNRVRWYNRLAAWLQGTEDVCRSTLLWTTVSVSMLVGLSLALAYSYGLERWTDTTERATDTAEHWRHEAMRCYSAVAPAVYLTERGYRVMRAYTQRRVVVETEAEDR